MTTLIIAILIVLISSAICSSAEAALFSVSVIKVKQLAEEDTKSGNALLNIKTDMNRPIAAIVVLNNVANIVGSIVIGGLATEVLGNKWIGYFSAALTFMVIIFSEIIPKTLGERYADKLSLMVSRPILFVSKIMSIVLWFIEKITYPITGKSPVKYTTNESEIKLLASIGDKEGVIESKESTFIKKVFELNDTTAKMIMTPRVSMTYLEGNDTLESVKDAVIKSQHSRIVVVGDTVDDIIGIAMKEDLLVHLINSEGGKMVKGLVRTAQFVEEHKTAQELLELFQDKRYHLAVVIDFYGGVSGVVTLEDVLEVLTGEIVDETDSVTDMQEISKRKNN
jgi:CBS domain containing-hemolysin-like protein